MVILISLRGFGDVVILRTIARRIAYGKPAGFVQVVTTERYSRLFVDDINIKLHILNMGTTLQSGFSINSNFLKDLLTLWKIRNLKIDQSIDFAGDIRERIIGLILGAKKHYFPKWKPGHPAGMWIRLNWFPKIRSNQVGLWVQRTNVYDIYSEIIEFALDSTGKAISDYINDSAAEDTKYLNRKKTKIVAIHPFAAQPSRMWEFDKWKELISHLEGKGFFVRIYCSPHDKAKVSQYLVVENGHNIEVIAEADVEVVERSLSEVFFVVCLDSFFVHLSAANSVPIIMINGSNNPAVWSPINTIVVSNGLVCSAFPCYNKPKCEAIKDWEYKCIRSVSVKQVLDAVETMSV